MNRLMFMTKIFLLSTQNPFDILGDPDTNKVETTLGVDGKAAFSLTDIAVLLKAFIVYGGFVTAVAALITMLFIRKNDKLTAEKKEHITRILVIIWLAGSAPTLFNILKSFLDGLFGFA